MYRACVYHEINVIIVSMQWTWMYNKDFFTSLKGTIKTAMFFFFPAQPKLMLQKVFRLFYTIDFRWFGSQLMVIVIIENALFTNNPLYLLVSMFDKYQWCENPFYMVYIISQLCLVLAFFTFQMILRAVICCCCLFMFNKYSCVSLGSFCTQLSVCDIGLEHSHWHVA